LLAFARIIIESVQELLSKLKALLVS